MYTINITSQYNRKLLLHDSWLAVIGVLNGLKFSQNSQSFGLMSRLMPSDHWGLGEYIGGGGG